MYSIVQFQETPTSSADNRNVPRGEGQWQYKQKLEFPEEHEIQSRKKKPSKGVGVLLNLAKH